MEATGRAEWQELRCAGCGARNRVQAGRSGPVCGRCREALVAGAPVVVTDATFGRQVEEQSGLVLVDFWAAWCGPCRMMAPVLDALAREYAGRLKVAKLDVDRNPRSAARFAIRSIPALLLFRDGRLVDEIVGFLPRPRLEARLASHLAAA